MPRIVNSLFLAAVLVTTLSGLALCDSSTNGAGGQMPAFYDGKQFTINFKQMSDNAAASIIAHNGSLNFIYMSDQAVDMGFNFASVLDAIQGDGFNPLWEEVQITFLTIAPQQFGSDDEILDAFAAGQIDLTFTGEVYRCSVVGSKK